MPVVTIEGPDGAGKSTLAESIAEVAELSNRWREVRVEHFGPPEYDEKSSLTPGQQEANQMLERVAGVDPYETFLILDRFHLGSAAYTSVFRPKLVIGPYGQMSEDDFDRVQEWLDRTYYVPVFIYADVDVLMDRLEDRGDEHLKSDSRKRRAQLEEVLRNYDSVLGYEAAMLGHEGPPRTLFFDGEHVTLENMSDHATFVMMMAAQQLDTAAMSKEQILDMLRTYEKRMIVEDAA